MLAEGRQIFQAEALLQGLSPSQHMLAGVLNDEWPNQVACDGIPAGIGSVHED